jgi:hypothetical protein
MTAAERMKAWESLDSPKPDWETFKRMLPSCNNNPLVVRSLWIRKNSGTSVKITNSSQLSRTHYEID